MIKLTIITLTSIFLLSGCVNKRGISATYYNDCREYYDIQGFYHKDCGENLIEFEDVKKEFKEIVNPDQEQQRRGNVY